MQSFIKSIISNRNLIYDLVGILVLLALGVGGLIIVSNPIMVLIPKHPMISAEDWTGSRATQGVEIIEARHWEENRELLIRLESRDDAEGQDAEIVQRSTWYADTTEAEAMWNHSYLSRDWQLISENYISRDNPASRLFCRYDLYPPIRTACYFYAYRGHWYTEINLSSWSNEYLSSSEIQQITNRANQLLMSASDEQITASLPIQPGPMSPPYVIVVAPTSAAIPNGFIIPTAIPTIISLNSCPSFQSGETRTVSPGTFIFGNVIIDDVTQYDSNIASEGTVAYFEKGSTVTAPFGADCYIGSSDSVYQVVQNELQYGCGSKCTSVRVVLVQNDGQHVEIYK